MWDGYGQQRTDQWSPKRSDAQYTADDPVGFEGQAGYYADWELAQTSNPASYVYLRSVPSLLTHRYYDAGTGRFINRDPSGYGGGANLYGFCGNNPVTNSDPSGNGYEPIDEVIDLYFVSSDIIQLTSDVRTHAPQAILNTDYITLSLDVASLLPLVPPGAGRVYAVAEGAQHLLAAYKLERRGAQVGVHAASIGIHLTNETTSSSITISLAKRGPKTGGAGPHNQTIARRIGEIQKQNPSWTHQAGGDLKEEYIPTPRGSKSARRPDITFRLPNGTRYREQVGKRTATGSPVQREIDAMDDIQQQTGSRPHFTPYN